MHKITMMVVCASLSLWCGMSKAMSLKDCQELAKSFANDPDALSQIDLGHLRTCVSDELSHRLSSNKRTAPPLEVAPPVIRLEHDVSPSTVAPSR